MKTDDLYSEFDPEAGGGGSAEIFDNDDGSAEYLESPEGEPSGSTVEREPQRQEPSEPSIPMSKFLEFVQGSRQQQAPPQAQPQMTREEWEQQMKVYRLNEDTFMKVFDQEAPLEKRIAALQSVIDGVAQHAAALSGFSARMAQQQVLQQITPLQQAFEQQVNERFVSSIEQQFPALKNYKQILNGIIEQMKAEGYQPPVAGPQGTAMAIQEVANRATQFIRVANPQFNPQGGSQQKQAGHGMPSMAGEGGSSGAGGRGQQQRSAPKKAWQDVFSPSK